MIDYSVIVRTTGKAGEKYQKLLNSISLLQPLPKEVIVVLPEGYDLPNERLGWEKFYFCPKGMVIQRLYGIKKCKTKYALITDDDIEFQPDFVSKLYKPLKNGEYGMSAGPLVSFFPKQGIQTFISIILGNAVPTILHKNRYNTLLKTTGYSYNRHIEENKLYETQSAAWTCFFANIEKLKSIKFEDELWLDKNGYSSHDDTAMFYKAWLYNVKTVIVSDAIYNHLDGKTSTRGNFEKVNYASGFNLYVFWHRFIYSLESKLISKLWCKICIGYRSLTQRFFNFLSFGIKRMTKSEYTAFNNGYKDAKKWVKSVEYKNLNNLIRK